MNNLIILAATAVPQAAEPELSLWSMIVKGGWLMIPIFILSIIAVYIFCERYMLLRKYTRISDTSRIKSGIVFLPAIFVER